MLFVGVFKEELRLTRFVPLDIVSGAERGFGNGGCVLFTYHGLTKEYERIQESCGGNSIGFRRGGRETLALGFSYLVPFLLSLFL